MTTSEDPECLALEQVALQVQRLPTASLCFYNSRRCDASQPFHLPIPPLPAAAMGE
ncbi:MAG: hypothetical protein WCA32_01380 [Chromatiaceae bacterium]